MIHVRREGVARRARPAPVSRDGVAKIVQLRRDVRTLRELHEDFRPHRILVKRRGRLGEDGAGEIEKHGRQ